MNLFKKDEICTCTVGALHLIQILYTQRRHCVSNHGEDRDAVEAINSCPDDSQTWPVAASISEPTRIPRRSRSLTL